LSATVGPAAGAGRAVVTKAALRCNCDAPLLIWTFFAVGQCHGPFSAKVNVAVLCQKKRQRVQRIVFTRKYISANSDLPHKSVDASRRARRKQDGLASRPDIIQREIPVAIAKRSQANAFRQRHAAERVEFFLFRTDAESLATPRRPSRADRTFLLRTDAESFVSPRRPNRWSCDPHRRAGNMASVFVFSMFNTSPCSRGRIHSTTTSLPGLSVASLTIGRLP